MGNTKIMETIDKMEIIKYFETYPSYIRKRAMRYKYHNLNLRKESIRI